MIHKGIEYDVILERNAENKYELIYKPRVKNDNNETGEKRE